MAIVDVARLEQIELPALAERTEATVMLDELGRQSPWSLTHSQRVAKGVLHYAVSVDLPEQMSLSLGFAGLLHDIDKHREFYQPYLASPDKLDEVGRSVMNKHAYGGYITMKALHVAEDYPGDLRTIDLARLVSLFHHTPGDKVWQQYRDPAIQVPGISAKLLHSSVALIKVADHMDAVTALDRPHGKKIVDPYVAIPEVLPRLSDEHDSIFGASVEQVVTRMATIFADQHHLAA